MRGLTFIYMSCATVDICFYFQEVCSSLDGVVLMLRTLALIITKQDKLKEHLVTITEGYFFIYYILLNHIFFLIHLLHLTSLTAVYFGFTLTSNLAATSTLTSILTPPPP